MATRNSGGNGFSGEWKLIGSVIALVAMGVAALWTLVSFVGVTYTPKTQHEDLVQRFIDERVARLDADKTFLTRREFQIWKDERDKLIEALKESDQRNADRAVTKDELKTHDDHDKEIIRSLQREVDSLTERLTRNTNYLLDSKKTAPP